LRCHEVSSATWQLSASPTFIARSTAAAFITGNTPGMPTHPAQTLVLGGSPNRLRQRQVNFVAVASST